MKRLSFCLVFTALLILSCGKSRQPLAPQSLQKPAYAEWEDFRYPLKVGNCWNYSGSFKILDVQPDSANADLTMLTGPYTTQVEILGRQPIDTINTFLFRETFQDASGSLSCEAFYANQNEGLYLYGYQNVEGTHALPKTGTIARLPGCGRAYASREEIINFFRKIPLHYQNDTDSMDLMVPPSRILAYPVRENQAWSVWSGHSTRRIISGEVMIECPAGSFACKKVEYLVDYDNDGVVDNDLVIVDYIGMAGLIKRTTVMKNVKLSAGNGLEPFISFTLQDEFVLTEIVPMIPAAQ